MATEQLDLFGLPISTESSPKKKGQILVKPVVIESTIIEEVVVIKEAKEKSNRGRKLKPKVEKDLSKAKPKRGRKSYTETYSDTDLIDVPCDEKLKEKLYYSISEVAKWFRLTISQLRFWEGEFDVLQPRKNRKGDRLFRPEDINNLKIIYHLLRIKKMTIEGAKDYLKAHQHKATPQVQLQQSLQNFKAFLLELKANLD